MSTSTILLLAFYISCASALALTRTTTSPPQVTSLAKRDDNLPTLTLDAISKYFPTGGSNPQPTGTSLQVFPTGIYDSVPDEGITVALGPDLRKQINDAASKACNTKGYAQDCENSLVSIIQQTDLAPHTKRFGPFALLALLSLGALIAVIWQEHHIQSTKLEVPEVVNLGKGDIAQVISMSGAPTFAVAQAGGSATPYTVTWQPPATSTSPNFITIETLPVDKDSHKAGDIVYRIPQDAASRINDFLAITGIQETQNICKGQDVKRADGVQECLQHIQRHAMDLADVGPSNLLQIAQQNIPVRPADGQAIGFPIETLAAEGIPILIPVYRVIYEHAPRRPDFDMGWDPVILAKSAAAIAIAAHAAMFVGESILEIWIPKDKVTYDLKEDRLSCPKDLLCVADECLGQENEKNMVGVSPYCKKVANFGCKCRPVNYPHVTTLYGSYLFEQYDFLEELIKKSALPSLQVDCAGGDQSLGDAANKVKDRIETVCKKHSDLKDSFQEVENLEAGFTFSLRFDRKGGDCAFDCATIFSEFVDEEKCMLGGMIQKNGDIKTDCGTASYVGYNLK